MKLISGSYPLLRLMIPLMAMGLGSWVGTAHASADVEAQVRQQFLKRAEQSMAIELQSQLLSEQMQRIRQELAAAGKAAAGDRAMCGAMSCAGSEVAAEALRKHLQSLQALLSSTKALQKYLHQMSGYAVKTEELLLEGEGGLHRQEMAIAVSSALVDFNQIITGNIGTLMKRLRQSTSDFAASTANVGGRTGMSALPDGKKADLRKVVATALGQTMQEGISAVFARNLKDSAVAASLTSEVLSQATDLITAELYNAYVAKPGAMEIKASSIGLGILRAGLEGVAKKQLREREKRAADRRQQLSENERSRLLWILQWRLAQRLYKNLQAAEAKATKLLTEFEGLAHTCKFRSRQLKQCRIEADEKALAISSKHQVKIDAATKNLEAARSVYEKKLKTLDSLKQKIAANDKEADEWNRKYAAARKKGSSKADYYRESRDMASQAAADNRLALRSHEIALDSEFGGSLRAAQLELQQTIERRQMAAEFAQDDAMKRVRACLYADAGQATPAGSSTPEKEASVLDELLAHAVKMQADALTAMQAVNINYDDEKCGKKKPAAVTGTPPAPPAPSATGISIDPVFAGLYSTGHALVNVSVEKDRIRGEVVEICEPMQRAAGTNLQAGDIYFEGVGSGENDIAGRLHFKLVSRLEMAEGSRPLECKWQRPRDQWVPARFYRRVHGGIFAIHGSYDMPLSLVECGTVENHNDLLLLSRPSDKSAGAAAFEDAFRRECREFAGNNPDAGRKIEVFRPPGMPEPPMLEQPLLEPGLLPEPPLLMPEPPR